MAKSSRASSRKANNQRLKANVFGPVELERNARLSAKLLELAAAPKPARADDESMNIIEADTSAAADDGSAGVAAGESKCFPSYSEERDTRKGPRRLIIFGTRAVTAMDIDAGKAAAASSKSSSKKGRVEKRKKRSKIVFPKYGDKTKAKRKH